MASTQTKIEWNGEQYLEAFRQVAQQELLALSLEIEGRVKANLIEDRVTASGAAGLLGSFVGEAHMVPDGVVMTVGSPFAYASYVELGTRPHWPPIQPIFQWVEKKLDITGYKVDYKEGANVRMRAIRQFGTAQAAARWKPQRRYDRFNAIMKIARNVQRAIAKRGTRPRLYMRKALESLSFRVEPVEDPENLSMTYRLDVAQWLAARGLGAKVRRRLRKL